MDAASPTAPAIDPLTRRQIEGSPARVLAAMAFPNLGEGLARIAFITCDAIFVGWLGTDALAGLGLVMPFFFLVQMLTAGGLGVGIAAAIARALGARRRDEAEALASAGTLIGLGFGIISGAVMLLSGAGIYRLMGGSGGALEQAIVYSTLVFFGAPLIALCNSLANIVRGTGRMTLSAGVIIAGEACHLTLSPILVLTFGMKGAALAALSPYLFGCVALGWHLLRGRGALRLVPWHRALRGQHFRTILGVGVMASFNTLQAQLIGVLLTALIGRFGPAALAGYTVALRLEMAQIPIVFAVGSALVAMVGTNMGAGQPARAKRIAWIGAAYAGAISGIVGLVAVAGGALWMQASTSDPAVIEAGARYLLVAGPAFPLFGIGLAIFFACQGAGRIWWPTVAALLRGVVTLGAGWSAVLVFGAGYDAALWATAAGFVVAGLVSLGVLALQPWTPQPWTPRPGTPRPGR